jgi:hypothetical protein
MNNPNQKLLHRRFNRMANLRQVLYQKYTSEGRDQVVAELRNAYESKKGDRFHIDGITYEVGQIMLADDSIEFEISSKIPLEELPGKEGAKKFFEAIKKTFNGFPKEPEYVSMDDIVHKVGEREIKKRDYVRVKYKYGFGELFNDQEIQREAEAIIRGEVTREVPEIPGVISVAGRLVLLALKESAYNYTKESMNRLIEANEKVRKEFKAN